MKICLCFLLLLVSAFSWGQSSSDQKYTFGTRGSFFFDTQNYDNALNYFHMNYKDETFKEKFTLKRNLEFRIFDPVTSGEKVVIDPTNVSMEILMNSTSVQVGFIRYRFSETFGLQILDIANPRDYSDYVFNDLSWSKRSVFGLNMQNKWDRLEALWILTLWPNGDRLPYRKTPFDLTDGQLGYEGGVQERAWFKDYEYGARFKYLFESGLDLGVLFYRHFSRPTLTTLKVVGPGQLKLEQSDRLVNSMGMAGSYVLGDWVIRGDALYTFKDNYQTSPITFETKDHYQHLIGVDRMWEQWILGLQLQSDFVQHRNFMGAKLENSSFEIWKPSTMVFVGNTYEDLWYQLKNSFEYDGYKLDVVIDLIHGEYDAKSIFGFYRDRDRILFDFSKTF